MIGNTQNCSELLGTARKLWGRVKYCKLLTPNSIYLLFLMITLTFIHLLRLKSVLRTSRTGHGLHFYLSHGTLCLYFFTSFSRLIFQVHFLSIHMTHTT